VLAQVAGAPVADVSAARAAIARLPAGADAVLQVRRGGSVRLFVVRPELWRALPADARAGVPAADLLSVEARAALRLGPEARVLAIDGAAPPSGAAELSAWRRRRGAAVAQLEAAGVRYLAVVEPGP
jgi:hypothetical protein